jgi:hypothetical protein
VCIGSGWGRKGEGFKFQEGTILKSELGPLFSISRVGGLILDLPQFFENPKAPTNSLGYAA